MNKKSIAFASGKGGTGKTSLAVNFAKYISGFMNVTLADLDVEEPNTGVYFKTENTDVLQEKCFISTPQINLDKCNYCGKCAQKCNFNAIAVFGEKTSVFSDLCKSCGKCAIVCPENAISFVDTEIGTVSTYSHGKLTIREGILNIGNIHTKNLIQDVKKHLDTKISVLDCPPGTTCPMVESVSDADFVILITEPTPFGLHDLSLAADVIQKLRKKTGIIINKSGSNDGIIEKFCNETGIKLIGKVPFSRDTAEKCGRGELYYTDSSMQNILKDVFSFVTEALND